MTPQTNYFNFWPTRILQTTQGNPESCSKNTILVNLNISEIRDLDKIEKAGPNNPEDPSTEFLQILRRYQYLSENMNWTFVNFN